VKYQGIWYPGQLEDMEVDSRRNKPHYLISCLQVTNRCKADDEWGWGKDDKIYYFQEDMVRISEPPVKRIEEEISRGVTRLHKIYSFTA